MIWFFFSISFSVNESDNDKGLYNAKKQKKKTNRLKRLPDSDAERYARADIDSFSEHLITMETLSHTFIVHAFRRFEYEIERKQDQGFKIICFQSVPVVCTPFRFVLERFPFFLFLMMNKKSESIFFCDIK